MTSYWTLPTAYTQLEALGLALEVGRGERESNGTDSQLTMPRHEFECWVTCIMWWSSGPT